MPMGVGRVFQQDADSSKMLGGGLPSGPVCAIKWTLSFGNLRGQLLGHLGVWTGQGYGKKFLGPIDVWKKKGVQGYMLQISSEIVGFVAHLHGFLLVVMCLVLPVTLGPRNLKLTHVTTTVD